MSHKKWKSEMKKWKRKKKRILAARARDCAESKDVDHINSTDSENESQRAEEEAERQRQNEMWLERERQAQLQFQAKKEWEAKEKLRKEETEKKIREEWEAREKKEKEELEKKEKVDNEKRLKQVKCLTGSIIDHLPRLLSRKVIQITFLQARWMHILRYQDAKIMEKLLKEATANENSGAWHNPIAPVTYSKQKDVEHCPFFKKTAACRFGDQCSRYHDYPDTSCTLLIPGMFGSFELEQSIVDSIDTDISLEYEDNELYQSFREFYHDVVPEFQSVGELLQLRVCCNCEPHLRGNVYVQYRRESAAEQAFKKFNARWYGGRQLTCIFVNIESWKSAICGLAFAKKCPKGKSCNFLHVFKNPGGEFSRYDSDWRGSTRQPSSYRSHRGYREDSRYNRSPSRSTRSRHRSRSRSRERYRTRSRSRDRRRSRSRSRDRRRSRSPSRDKHRSRSMSKDKRRSRSQSKDRLRSRSRSKNRHRSRSRSRGRSNSKNRYHSSKGKHFSKSPSRSNSSVTLSKQKKKNCSPRSTSRSRDNGKRSKSKSRSRSRSRSRSDLKNKESKSQTKSRLLKGCDKQDSSRSRSSSREVSPAIDSNSKGKKRNYRSKAIPDSSSSEEEFEFVEITKETIEKVKNR